jgi:hypothetical protein
MFRSTSSAARRVTGPAALAFLGAVLLLCTSRPIAQTYSSGQPVWPAFEGWERNDDGSFSLVFGYMNDNWAEEPNVPIGPENNIQPGPPDQGQPTHFQPRRNRFVFRVRVPKTFGEKEEVVWTLTTQGKPQKAYASLRIDSLIENIDIMSETGALGAGASSPEIRADKAPIVKIDGAKTRTAKVGQPVALSALMTDDGVPPTRPPQQPGGGGRNPALQPPFRPTVNKSLGLHISWYVYRGAGKVTFDPPSIKAWEDTRTGANSPWAPYWVAPPKPADNKYAVQATFAEPGTYVICARGDDGALTADDMVTINVSR